MICRYSTLVEDEVAGQLLSGYFSAPQNRFCVYCLQMWLALSGAMPSLLHVRHSVKMVKLEWIPVEYRCWRMFDLDLQRRKIFCFVWFLEKQSLTWVLPLPIHTNRGDVLVITPSLQPNKLTLTFVSWLFLMPPETSHSRYSQNKDFSPRYTAGTLYHMQRYNETTSGLTMHFG